MEEPVTSLLRRRPGLVLVTASLLLVCGLACGPAAGGGAPPAGPASPTAGVAAVAPPRAAEGAPAGAASTAPPAPPAPATVRVGVLNSIGDAPFAIGLEKGYYAEQGITIETVPFDSAARMIAPFGAGQLDAGQGAISAG